MRALVLDNEAVQALQDERHPKHRQVLAHLAGVVGRRRRGRDVAVAAVRSLPHDEVVVLTSDPDDITRVAGDRPVRPVRV